MERALVLNRRDFILTTAALGSAGLWATAAQAQAQQTAGKPVILVLGDSLSAEYGLKRGENGLRLIMMCEIPANALLAEQFLEYFDGFSIGSNDLTQLTLGMDRDSGILADGFDERNDAVKVLLKMAINTCNRLGKYVGICGQGPSDHEDFAEWLVAEGIQSVSLNPDTVVATWQRLTKK